MRAELLAARTARSTVRFVACAWALALFLTVSFLGVRELEHAAARDALTAITSASAAGLILLLLAAASMSGETRHGTLPGALVADPRRVRFVLVKASAHALIAAAAGLAGALLSTLFVLVVAVHLPPPGEIAGALLRLTLYCGLMGALGTGLGAAIPSQPAALGAALGLLLVADPLLASLSEPAARYGPGGAGAALIGNDEAGLLPAVPGGLLLAGYAAAAVLAGAWRTSRRDVL